MVLDIFCNCYPSIAYISIRKKVISIVHFKFILKGLTATNNMAFFIQSSAGGTSSGSVTANLSAVSLADPSANSGEGAETVEVKYFSCRLMFFLL